MEANLNSAVAVVDVYKSSHLIPVLTEKKGT
jgi:hypothetical protein